MRGSRSHPYTAIKRAATSPEAQDAVRRGVAAFPVADVTDAGARTPLLLAREKPDNDGLLGALKGLWSLVADWERFAWFDANTGQVRKTVTLFGNACHAGSTPDGSAYVRRDWRLSESRPYAGAAQRRLILRPDRQIGGNVSRKAELASRPLQRNVH